MPSAHRSHATRPRKRGSPRRHQADRGFDRGVGSGLGLQRKHRKARDARRGLVVVPVQRDELAHVNPPLGSHVVTLLVTARGALGCDLAVVHPLFMFERLAVHFGQRNSRTLPACRVLGKGRGPVMWGTDVGHARACERPLPGRRRRSRGDPRTRGPAGTAYDTGRAFPSGRRGLETYAGCEPQRVSRCSVCLPHLGQNLANANRSGSLRRFFLVM